MEEACARTTMTTMATSARAATTTRT